jgi:hypothetical protein
MSIPAKANSGFFVRPWKHEMSDVEIYTSAIIGDASEGSGGPREVTITLLLSDEDTFPNSSTRFPKTLKVKLQPKQAIRLAHSILSYFSAEINS